MWIENIDPSFGHWLAGFTDGEGCFDITAVGLNKSYICRFVIGLRGDDREVLTLARDATGLGSVTTKMKAGTTSNPQAWWSIHAKSDCVRLTELFDRFPLRAKKSRDFAVWRQAVQHWAAMPRAYKGRDWQRMADLKCELTRGRRYQAAPACLAPPEHLALALF